MTSNLLSLSLLFSLLTPAFSFASIPKRACNERLTENGSCLYRTGPGRGSVITAEGRYFMRTSRGWHEDRSIEDFCSQQGLGKLITKELSNDVRERAKNASLSADRLNFAAELLSDVNHWTNKKIVDLGTGDGRLVFELRDMGIEAEGLDLALGNEQLGLPFFFEADIRETGLPSEQYDIAISAFNIFHYSQTADFYDQALSEIHRILKPGGLLIIIGLNNVNSKDALIRHANKLQSIGTPAEKHEAIADLVLQKL